MFGQTAIHRTSLVVGESEEFISLYPGQASVSQNLTLFTMEEVAILSDSLDNYRRRCLAPH